MAIDLYWDDDAQTTLLCVFDGRWSWDELFATLKTIQRLTDANKTDQKVGAIIDVRKGMHLPDGLFTPQTLNQAKKLLGMQSDGQPGPMVVVGVNPMIRIIFDAVATLDRHAVTRVQFVATLAQAREQLHIRHTV